MPRKSLFSECFTSILNPSFHLRETATRILRLYIIDVLYKKKSHNSYQQTYSKTKQNKTTLGPLSKDCVFKCIKSECVFKYFKIK